jgi:hypothetical protein
MNALHALSDLVQARPGLAVQAPMLLAPLSLLGCVGTVAAPDEVPERTADIQAPIQDGYYDDATLAVIGVAGVDEDGQLKRTCSGTLIAPDLVLTAQHCVAQSPRRIQCKGAWFGPLVDPANLRIGVCDQLRGPCTEWYAVRKVMRPLGGDAVCGHDIALLLLDSPVPDDRATPLSPRLDEPPEAGEVYSAVGFGRTDVELADSGFRRRRNGLRVTCVAAACDPSSITEGEWQGESGTCKGDSGGPALDAAESVIGVASRGRGNCERPVYSGLAAHREWVLAEGARAAWIGRYAAPAWVLKGIAVAAR